jgi:hypothetical protein
LFASQFCLQLIHFKDQFPLDFTRAKEAGLVSRKGLYTEERKNKKEKEQKEARPPKRTRKKWLPKAAHQKK